MSRIIIGIDPGISGGIALLSSDGQALEVHDMPIIRDKSLAFVDGQWLGALLDRWPAEECQAIVERVHSMPAQGVSSSFTFGVSFGSILGVLRTLCIPIELVTPVVWKRDMGLTSDKRSALDKARLLFPSMDLARAKDDGRAEALLIARWYWRKNFTTPELKIA